MSGPKLDLFTICRAICQERQEKAEFGFQLSAMKENHLHGRPFELAAIVIVVGALIAAVVVWNGNVERELRRLPAGERRALYQRTLETLRTSCVHATGAKLSEYCIEQAEFISRFEECDSDCRELAHQFTPKPKRGFP